MTVLQDLLASLQMLIASILLIFGFGLNFKLIGKVDGIGCKATGPRRQHLSWGGPGVLHSKG